MLSLPLISCVYFAQKFILNEPLFPQLYHGNNNIFFKGTMRNANNDMRKNSQHGATHIISSVNVG